MTLKELRIELGLNQSECAKIIGISLRTYQSYENDLLKQRTIKYQVFLNKLKDHNNYIIREDAKPFYLPTNFKTNVIIGNDLKKLNEKVTRLEKRDCYQHLKRFITNNFDGKICILYGLRRTGKTTLLFQLIGDLPIEKTAYIKLKTNQDMGMLCADLDLLHYQDYKYILLDEITLLDDFIDSASILSDIYSMLGMKIIVSGTDSLGFYFADWGELYDRNIKIHTTYIPFSEYSRLMNKTSIDEYIEYGGTLMKENMNLDDPDYNNYEVSFRDDESTRKYIDLSISNNIQNSLRNNNDGQKFLELRELYAHDELTNVITRIVENFHHSFTIDVINERFKSHDLGSARNLLHKSEDYNLSLILDKINKNEVISVLKKIINVKEINELNIEITDRHINQIKKYLQCLDLIKKIDIINDDGNRLEKYLFVQPGMRYAIAKALVYSLFEDEYFNTLDMVEKKYVIDKILGDVKGRMMEEIILLEVSNIRINNQKVFKYEFVSGGEFDMVIYHEDNNTCDIYEIKHSDKVNDQQRKYLENEEYLKTIEQHYGKIISRNVLYRGKDVTINGINYLNVEKYLINLKR